MSQINAHKIKIGESILLPVNNIEKGMIVSFSYTDLNDKSNKYMAVVLNPKYEDKIHCLSMDHINTIFFENWAKKMGLIFSKRIQKIRKVNISKLLMEQSSGRFYNAEIKRQISQASGLNNSYRIFFLNKIKNLYAINYEFSFVNESYLKGMKII